VIICLGHASQHTSLQPTWNSRETSSLPSRRSSSLFGLAPGGGCPAGGIAAPAGGLLHHHFTLTPGGAVCFCGPIRQISPPRTLSGTVLDGVRTFLTPRRGRNHLADLGFHDNTGGFFLEGGVNICSVKWLKAFIYLEEKQQRAGQIVSLPLKCPFDKVLSFKRKPSRG